MAGLVLHALTVGGGILAISSLPGVGGDYAGDLSHIGDWQPGLVISTTTTEEMAQAGAEKLGTDLQSMGCRWVHLPILDYSPPPEDVIADWKRVSASAIQALFGGGRVLIHCHGGCGRSGMIALRLMIESGEDGDAALRRLRSVRSCAVETEAQMAWAMRRT